MPLSVTSAFFYQRIVGLSPTPIFDVKVADALDLSDGHCLRLTWLILEYPNSTSMIDYKKFAPIIAYLKHLNLDRVTVFSTGCDLFERLIPSLDPKICFMDLGDFSRHVFHVAMDTTAVFARYRLLDQVCLHLWTV